MLNEVKDKLEIPDLMKDVDIVSIPKKNKDVMNIDERRGIYIINIFRNILLKLVYKEKFSVIDENMTDFQVGGHKLTSVKNPYFVFALLVIVYSTSTGY